MTSEQKAAPDLTRLAPALGQDNFLGISPTSSAGTCALSLRPQQHGEGTGCGAAATRARVNLKMGPAYVGMAAGIRVTTG